MTHIVNKGVVVTIHTYSYFESDINFMKSHKIIKKKIESAP